LHEQIDDLVMLTEQASETGDQFEQTLTQSVNDYLVQRCLNELPELDEGLVRSWIKLDAGLNAQGLAFWWQYKRAA